MPKTRKHSGYVLAMILVLLATTTLALVGTARLSLQRVGEAVLAQQQLQRTWGTLSCEQTLLIRAEQSLLEAEADDRQRHTSVRRSLRLGGMGFELVVGDEQAKANANVLLQRRGKQDAERVLREVLAGSPLASRLGLRAADVSAHDAGMYLMPIGTYGQMLEATPVRSILDPAGADGAFVDRVSCWGSGQLNFHRADDRTVRALVCPTLNLSQAEQLLQLRRASPALTLADALDRLQLTKETRTAALALLSDGSACHSVWVVARSERRSWYRLTVQQNGQRGGRVVVFEW